MATMKLAGKSRPVALFVGLATVDLTYPVDAIPRRNQKISVAAQHIAAGGPATNAAATFAFLGGRASLVSAVGSHPLASVIHRDLDQLGIALHDLAGDRTEPPPISTSLLLRSTGERTVVSANAAVFSPLKAEFNPRWLRGVSILLVDGQYMSLCIAVAREGHSRGIPVVMDSGSWKDRMDELLPHVDIAICSADFRPPNCRAEGEVCEFLARRGIGRMAITHGASPTHYVDHGRRGRIVVPKVRAVDTLGAGDIFHGAFCHYVTQPGSGFRDSLVAAARVASFSCRHVGTRSWMWEFKP